VWLDEQTPEALRHWLRSTSIPMLATSPDGNIFWANAAFENLTGYTAAEFHDGSRPVKWTHLTVDHEDLQHDLDMAEAVVRGSRTEYQLVKQYRTKSGDNVSVNIHVLRYPLAGDFTCFLVSVYSLAQGSQTLMKELQELHSTLLSLIEQQAAMLKGIGSEDTFWQWCRNNPKLSAPLGVFLAFLICGDRVVEILQLIRDVFKGG
jgi:PAS domain S-box-containing protein